MDVGVIIRTPYGWGIVESVHAEQPFVKIKLDWECDLQAFIDAAKSWTRSYASLGACVETKYGCGVLLDFRRSDGMHKVSLWRRRGLGNSIAWLHYSSFLRTVVAICGFPVSLGAMNGTVQKITNTSVQVKLNFGIGYWAHGKVSCPVAKVMPVVDSFLQKSIDAWASNAGLLHKLKDAVQNSGLLDTGFQEQIMTNMQDAIGTVSKIVDGQGSYEDIALAMSERILMDDTLKKLLRKGIKRVKALANAGHPITNTLMTRHWAYSPSTVANRVYIISTFDSLNDWERMLKEKPWFLFPSTVSNRVHGGPMYSPKLGASIQSLYEYVPEEVSSLKLNSMIQELQAIAKEDPSIQDVYTEIKDRMKTLQDMTKQIKETKMAGMITKRAAEVQSKVQNAPWGKPELATDEQASRLHKRGQELLKRMEKEQSAVKAKVAEFATAGVDKYVTSIPFEKVEEWITYAKEQMIKSWEEYRGKLFSSLQCFDVQEHVVNLKWMDPELFPRALEDMLSTSKTITAMSGTHVRDLYDKYGQKINFQQYSSRSLLKMFEENGMWIPQPIVDALTSVSQGGGAMQQRTGQALMELVDSEESVEAVGALMSKGENAIDSLMQYAKQPQSATSGAIMNAVLGKLEEAQGLEDSLFEKIASLDARQMLDQAETALSSAEELEKLANSFKDATLEFVLSVLPGLKIPRVDGSYEVAYVGEIMYTIENLDMSGFHFVKEDVQLVFPQDRNVFSVDVHAQNVSAVFKNLNISLEQKSFPYFSANPLANAISEGISMDLTFTMCKQTGSLELTHRKIIIDELALSVESTSWAVVMNAFAQIFSDQIKVYVKNSLEEALDKNVGPLIEKLNGYIENLPAVVKKRVLPEISENSSSEPFSTKISSKEEREQLGPLSEGNRGEGIEASSFSTLISFCTFSNGSVDDVARIG